MNEKTMPRWIKNKIHEIDCAIEGSNTEAAVLDKCSELGYEVVDEHDGRINDEGGFLHNVKVKDDAGHVAWIHFNHPGKEYAKHNGEWYWYFM